jgi:hypothetical protein
LWNLIPVRINYKYDLPILIDDIPPLIDTLMSSELGSYQVSWGSNSFRAKWYLEWVENQLTISSDWDSVAGNYEALLNQNNQIVVDKLGFLNEWKVLLIKIIESVKISGIQIKNQEEFTEICNLSSVLPKFGKLYDN